MGYGENEFKKNIQYIGSIISTRNPNYFLILKKYINDPYDESIYITKVDKLKIKYIQHL